MRRARLLLLPIALTARLEAQWTLQTTGTSAEFRGLHAVNSKVVWAAGKGGTVARTRDGGRTWQSDSIPGAGGLFLVGIHAVDRRRAWVLGTAFSGPPLARIYHTEDGGRTWRVQYENSDSGVFFDGMAFWDEKHGIAFGDPMEGHFPILLTENGGARWAMYPPGSLEPALPGEAAFAASGTAIAVLGDREAWIGTGGGAHARVFHSADQGATWEVFDTPVLGDSGKGIFGIAMGSQRQGVAVGGNYLRRDASADNLLLTDDGGHAWRIAMSPGLTGVQYGVAHAGGQSYVSVGPTGSSLSRDGGSTWIRLTGPGFNTVSCLPGSGVCWAAGEQGRIARMTTRP